MASFYRLLTFGASTFVIPALYARSLADHSARRRFRERLGWIPDRHDGAGAGPAATADRSPSRTGSLWIHAVSVGEVRTAETFLRSLRGSQRELRVDLSSTTEAGLARASALVPPGVVDRVFAYPLDRPGPVRRALDAVRPAAYGTIETEIWPEMLAECGRRGIPGFIVNGSISDRSAKRYRFLSAAVRPALAALRAACMQSEGDAARIVSLGASESAVRVCGNIKFDAAPADLSQRVAELRRILGLAPGAPVLIAGSTAPGEEAIVVEAWRKASGSIPGLVLIVAPRHRERFDEAASILSAAGAPVVRRSRASGADPHRAGVVILLDTLGELEAAYSLAQVAFVGGSLVPRGGQNPLEPARAGVPVLFGPGMDNFREIADALLAIGGAFEVRDAEGLATVTARLMRDASERERASLAARRFVEKHSGATTRTLDALAVLIPDVFGHGLEIGVTGEGGQAATGSPSLRSRPAS
jgi:3-deoxy-D-manno-octulosonic-acid transferase